MSSASLEQMRGTADLIEDIHRQQRRRVQRRVAQAAVVLALLLAAGIAFTVLSDRRARGQSLQTARTHLMLGTFSEVGIAVQTLELGLKRSPSDPEMTGLRGLARGHAWLEFGLNDTEARAALRAVGPDNPAAPVAAAMLAFGEGDIASAASALASVVPGDETPALVTREAVWLGGLVAVALGDPDRPDAEGDDPLTAARHAAKEWLALNRDDIAMRRMLAYLQLHSGLAEEALVTLDEARRLSDRHMGLAADEALYHAVLRRELAGVASVADQLLDSESPDLSRTDRAHAVLARAVVHVHSGERDTGLSRLDEAWEELEPWNVLDRRLAIETALEAGDISRVVRWVEEARLPDGEADIFVAWGVLLGGDVMTALSLLARLEQTHPRVAYLQALALVEQGRFPETTPWLLRTEKLLPGRVEIEVARARTELRTGNKAMALRKLKALAEEEPYAPRAWTGLGEAYLLQNPPDPVEAKRALQRAVDREPIAAEALFLLGEAARLGKRGEPAAELEALRLYERAAEVGTHMPKYGAALALQLARLGSDARAAVELEAQVDRPGVGFEVPLALVDLLQRADAPDLVRIGALLDVARDRGAAPGELSFRRARILLSDGGADALDEARGLLEDRVASKPEDVRAWAVLVRIILSQRDVKGAESALRRGLAAAAAGTKARLYFEWARLESRVGRLRVAAPRSRRAWLDLLAERRGAWELLDAADLSVSLWLRSKNERVALTIAKQLTERLVYHSDAWTIRAEVELHAGEARDARTSADKAIELDADNPRAHAILGHCLLRFGYRDEARAAYERAIALAKGTSRERSFRANLKRL